MLFVLMLLLLFFLFILLFSYLSNTCCSLSYFYSSFKFMFVSYGSFFFAYSCSSLVFSFSSIFICPLYLVYFFPNTDITFKLAVPSSGNTLLIPLSISYSLSSSNLSCSFSFKRLIFLTLLLFILAYSSSPF